MAGYETKEKSKLYNLVRFHSSPRILGSGLITAMGVGWNAAACFEWMIRPLMGYEIWHRYSGPEPIAVMLAVGVYFAIPIAMFGGKAYKENLTDAFKAYNRGYGVIKKGYARNTEEFFIKSYQHKSCCPGKVMAARALSKDMLMDNATIKKLKRLAKERGYFKKFLYY